MTVPKHDLDNNASCRIAQGLHVHLGVGGTQVDAHTLHCDVWEATTNILDSCSHDQVINLCIQHIQLL